MLLLVTSALPTVLLERGRLTGGERLGRLLTPRHYSAAPATAAAGVPWAADSDGFGTFHPGRYCQMLQAIAGVPGCLFVAAPDRFTDHLATLELWREWAPIIHAHGLPPALVLQDGITPDLVPWDELGALFVGGTDPHRGRPEFLAILREAQERGLHVHHGRIGGRHRIARAAELGASSVDGSGAARFRDAKLPGLLLAALNSATHPPSSLLEVSP